MEIQEEIETTDSNKYKYRNIGKVIYLSLSFMIYFSAANSGLLTNSEIYDQKVTINFVYINKTNKNIKKQ